MKNVPARAAVQGLLGGSAWLIVGGMTALPRQHEDGPYRDSVVIAVGTVGADTAVVIGRFARQAYFAKNGIPGPTQNTRSALVASLATSVRFTVICGVHSAGIIQSATASIRLRGY